MWKLSLFLSIIWAVALLYGEMFAFWLPSVFTCSWPHLQKMVNGTNPGDYVKVAVVTDPQLMDRTSLHLAPNSLALEIAQFYTDVYMRRAMLSSILPFKPEVILFLGDYFDGGPVLSDEEWQESLNRFRHIFNLNIVQRASNTKIYYLPGNHDIGYAAFHSQVPQVIKRYEEKFGSRNYQFTLGNVDFIAIDAQSVDAHLDGKAASATWDFVRSVSQNSSSNPRVLLTHIPLYRANLTPCGPHRSSSIINQRIHRAVRDQEIIYQNYVTENSTNELLDLIKPVLVLSGHDHDQCTVTHKFKDGHVKEHTVGTISWQQGNLVPSFMLLSVSNLTLTDGLSSDGAISTTLCFLPNQTYIYIWYIFLFVMTLILVLFGPTNEDLVIRKLGDLLGGVRSSVGSLYGSTKEKNDDDEGEYEMIWDAEGSMHLIKKTSKGPSTRSNERASAERGNAVMRSAARKHGTQEGEVLIPLDVNVNVGSDASEKLSGRPKKSKMKVIIWKLLRVLRVVFVIAMINLPLYMMLLFKDWIDK